MKTSAVPAADLSRTVIAVSPLARPTLDLNPAANRELIRRLEGRASPA